MAGGVVPDRRAARDALVRADGARDGAGLRCSRSMRCSRRRTARRQSPTRPRPTARSRSGCSPQARSVYSRDDLVGRAALRTGRVAGAALAELRQGVHACAPRRCAPGAGDRCHPRGRRVHEARRGRCVVDPLGATGAVEGGVLPARHASSTRSATPRASPTTRIASWSRRRSIRSRTSSPPRTTTACSRRAEVTDPNGNRVAGALRCARQGGGHRGHGEEGRRDRRGHARRSDHHVRVRPRSLPAVGQAERRARSRARACTVRPNTRWQESYSYTDGSGHEVMKKAQAEPRPGAAAGRLRRARARRAGEARARGREPAMGGDRPHGARQQGQPGQAVRAVLQRHVRVRGRGRAGGVGGDADPAVRSGGPARSGPTCRTGRSARSCSTRGRRRTSTRTTRCWRAPGIGSGRGSIRRTTRRGAPRSSLRRTRTRLR